MKEQKKKYWYNAESCVHTVEDLMPKKKNKEKEYNKTIITIYKWKCVLHISFFKQKCNWT